MSNMITDYGPSYLDLDRHLQVALAEILAVSDHPYAEALRSNLEQLARNASDPNRQAALNAAYQEYCANNAAITVDGSALTYTVGKGPYASTWVQAWVRIDHPYPNYKEDAE